MREIYNQIDSCTDKGETSFVWQPQTATNFTAHNHARTFAVLLNVRNSLQQMGYDVTDGRNLRTLSISWAAGRSCLLLEYLRDKYIKTLEEKINTLEQKYNELWYSPNMPGALDAQTSFHTARETVDKI